VCGVVVVEVFVWGGGGGGSGMCAMVVRSGGGAGAAREACVCCVGLSVALSVPLRLPRCSGWPCMIPRPACAA
jgi:hypothetical protein